MTKIERPGPGLSDEQWDRMKALATSLSPEQSNWVGGYFTGFADATRLQSTTLPVPVTPVVAPAPQIAQRSLTVLYGSETGNGSMLAEVVAKHATSLGLTAKAVDMSGYRSATLKEEQDLLIITSTHGEGEPPQPALPFFEYLQGKKAPRLAGARFAVLALGDSNYEFYCEAGKRLDTRLEELGAERLAPRIECDVDQLKHGERWAIALVDRLAGEARGSSLPTVAALASAPAASASASHDQTSPFQAEVLENIVITGRGSSKETRHIEISLEGSGLTYEPGDALGIVAGNDPRVAAELLDALKLDGAASVEVNGRLVPLATALERDFEIATATPRFLTHWAKLAGTTKIVEAPRETADRAAYLEAHHVIDIVRRYPVAGLSSADLLAGLRGLQPRLYSIASSQAAADGDVHLTVATVRYRLHDTERWGVVSGALGRLPEDATLPVYVKTNPHFRLPADDVPILMIGAGTGVAPYRAFLQERELRGAKGRSWLVFGDRNFRSDFLYQTEWQEHLSRGSLSLMDAVFSRDGASKTYVQHRLLERGYEVFAWLEDGAHVYLCGDAKGMAPAVHQALVEIVAAAGQRDAESAEEYLRDLQLAGRYQRDVY